MNSILHEINFTHFSIDMFVALRPISITLYARISCVYYPFQSDFILECNTGENWVEALSKQVPGFKNIEFIRRLCLCISHTHTSPNVKVDAVTQEDRKSVV